MSASTLPAVSPSAIEIESIVRLVMHRLRSGVAREAESESATLADRVITLESLRTIPADQRSIAIKPAAIVTPAARDELKQRGITLISESTRSIASMGSPKKNSPIHLSIEDDPDGKRIETMRRQLTLRGIDCAGAAATTVVVATCPATTLQRLHVAGRRALLVSRLADVTRFAIGFRPDAYVLDPLHLNLMQQINACVQIARQPSFKSGVSA